MSDVIATWDISLNCECPSCKEDVDLMSNGDFWVDRRLDPLETGTDQSRDVEVVCPECSHEFAVDLEY